MIRCFLLLFGVSVSFAQIDLSLDVLNKIDEIYEEKQADFQRNHYVPFYKEMPCDSGTISFKNKKYSLDANSTTTISLNENLSFSLSRKDESRIKEQATILLSNCEKLKDSINVNVVSYEYEKRDSNSEKVVGESILVNRKIDKYPIRGGSFIQIDVNSKGFANKMKVKWPTYSIIEVDSSIDFSKQKEMHIENLKEMLESFYNSFEMENLDVIGSIETVLPSYRQTKTENGNFLVPSITYVIKYLYDTDEKYLILDIPIYDVDKNSSALAYRGNIQ